MRKILKNRFTFLILIFTVIVYTWTVFNTSKWKRNLVINNDAVSYYSYLPATFIYNDLTFRFADSLPRDFEGRIWYQQTTTGERVQKMTMGLSVMYSPFFFLAHSIAHITAYDANGYSKIYSMFICFAGLFYGLLGLIILSKIVLQFFNDKITALSIIIIAFGTNLFYYVTNEGEMSHAFSFFLFALFFYFTLKWHNSQSLINTVFLGLVGGLIVLVRSSNIVVFIVPLFYGVYNINTGKQKWTLLRKNWIQLVLIFILVVLIFSPQLIYWKTITGKWFYYSYGSEGFFFTKPHILDGLFSYRKGWLVYTPVMLLALAGIPLLFRDFKEFSLAIPVFLVINIYIIFSWWSWWYGGGFGARPLIESYVFLTIPLTAFLRTVFEKKKIIKATVVTVIFVFISLNLFQTLQYRRTLIHWDSMTKEAYWAVFGKLKFPENYQELIQTPDYESALTGEPEIIDR